MLVSCRCPFPIRGATVQRFSGVAGTLPAAQGLPAFLELTGCRGVSPLCLHKRPVDVADNSTATRQRLLMAVCAAYADTCDPEASDDLAGPKQDMDRRLVISVRTAKPPWVAYFAGIDKAACLLGTGTADLINITSIDTPTCFPNVFTRVFVDVNPDADFVIAACLGGLRNYAFKTEDQYRR